MRRVIYISKFEMQSTRDNFQVNIIQKLIQYENKKMWNETQFTTRDKMI